MRPHRFILLLVALGIAFASRALVAHHSEAAEYDSTKPVKVEGILSKYEWTNPHVWVYIDVTEADGKHTTWGFSTAPPGSLMRRGVKKEQLKIGSKVNAEGIRARDGSPNAAMRRLTFEDGTSVLAAEAGR